MAANATTEAHRPTWKTLLAFAIIYFVWGSTFLAIRVGVREVPPLVLAAMRFSIAGAVLYGWMLARGERSPTARQWGSASLLGIVIFVFDYGLLFWAEQRVPSGIAAVMLATIEGTRFNSFAYWRAVETKAAALLPQLEQRQVIAEQPKLPAENRIEAAQ